MNSETTLYILLIVLQVGIAAYFINRSRKQKKARELANNSAIAPDSYEARRNTAMNVIPQQLGLNMQPGVTKVYGIVMDWDMSGTVLSLNAYITGAANAFLSSGSAITGVGANPAIAEQASTFVQEAQEYLAKCMPVSDTGLPLPGTVRFFLLTNKGIYASQEMLSAINDNASPWVGLFFRGTMLLDEIKQNAR